MSARQNKKRKGRSHVNNRERTVTTFTQDPNTSLLVPLSSEDPPAFAMHYQQQFYQPVLPPGKNDLEILENLKSIIKEGQHEFYRALPQPAALAALYMGHVDPRDSPAPVADSDPTPLPLNNPVEPETPTSPIKLAPEVSSLSSAQPPEPEDAPQATTQGPADTNTDPAGPGNTASPNKETAHADEKPLAQDAWERRTFDDKSTRYDDYNPNPPQVRSTTYDNNSNNNNMPQNGTSDPPDDRRFHDRDRDRDRDHWDRDRDRHDSNRDVRDRNRDRDIRDRRPEFFGRSYGRSHAPRPPPELRHYEPSYGDDYVPPPRRFDPDDRRGAYRNTSFDDRSKPPPLDDRRPPPDDRRSLPPPSIADDRRLATLDDRPMRRPAASDTRGLPPVTEDRRPPSDPVPLPRAIAEDDRGARATSLAADDRPRPNLPLEERLSQPGPIPSLQDRLSQPAPPVVPARAEVASAPSLGERLSSGPVPPRAYPRSTSVARDDLRAPPPKDESRDHDRVNDFRANRDFSRERPGGPPPSASTYRPDLDRTFGDRDGRDRRDRDVPDIDAPPARYGDAFSRPALPPPRRYSPPPLLDRDRERDRGRGYYPTRSPPPLRGESIYDLNGDRRFAIDRERDAYEQRRRDYYGPGDDDKRGIPPPASWRPHDRPPFMDRDRDRFDRERERDRDFRERDRERERDLVPLQPPTRGQWDDRDRRVGFPPSPPLSRMDTAGGARSLSARLTDPYPPPGSDDRAYPPREFGRYGGVPLVDHTHPHPQPFSRVRNRSPSPLRRGPGLADDLRPPVKRVREDNIVGYPTIGLGVGGGTAYSPPRRGGVGGGDYPPGPPPSSAATTATTGVTTVAARSTGTRTPPMSAPSSSVASGAFYERDRERERERDREYVRGEYGVGYDRDDRGRRSPPLLGSRIGSGASYARGVIGDRRDDRRYVPPPPPRTS